jgi:hypothetical protein
MAVTFYNGFIADTPATPADQVRVSVPNLTIADRIVYGPLDWEPEVDSSGRALAPTRGDAALIAIDDSAEGSQWIVSWKGTRVLSPLTVSNVPISSVGVAGSKRAGRQLTLADFTTLLGVAAPIALYNMDSLNDSSGNGRTLTVTTQSPVFDTGITGAANEAARFHGSNVEGLFIADANGGPFNFRTGTWGCWFKISNNKVSCRLMGKGTNVAGARSWLLSTDPSQSLKAIISSDGTNNLVLLGSTRVADERWHFGVSTYDGDTLRLYVDGDLDASSVYSTGTTLGGDLFQGSMPFNIGSTGITAAAGTGSENLPTFGWIDEAFVHPEVLDLEQIRMLMAASVPHGLTAAPSSVTVKVKRRKRGGPFAVTDFPATPRRLYNFTNTSQSDQGADGANLTAFGTITSVDGIDGQLRDAKSFPGLASNYYSTTAPAAFAAAARSVGCWFQTGGSNPAGNQMTVLCLGGGTASDWRPLFIQATGVPSTWDGTGLGADGGLTGYVTNVWDGQPHFWVAVWDNAEPAGLKRKIYLDGLLVGADTSFTTPTIGTGSFFIGELATGVEVYKGLLDGVFVLDYALTAEQIATLFAVGSRQLPLAMMDSALVEGMDATNVYMLAHRMDPQHLLDIQVAA